MAYFKADIQSLNFARKSPYEKIDEWHEIRSNGIIKDISMYASDYPKMLVSNVTSLQFGLPVSEVLENALLAPAQKTNLDGFEISRVSLEDDLTLYLIPETYFSSIPEPSIQDFRYLEFSKECIVHIPNSANQLSSTTEYHFLDESFVSEELKSSLQMIEPVYSFDSFLHGATLSFKKQPYTGMVRPDAKTYIPDSHLFVITDNFSGLIVAEGRL